MQAMVLSECGTIHRDDRPLVAATLRRPEPAAEELLLKVLVCGVCHTEIDEIEGRTPPPVLPIVPGHEVIALVEQVGSQVSKFRTGDRVGVGWIHSSSGGPEENLSPQFRATGRDVNGGYAEYMTVPEQYAFPVPEIFEDAEAAPLLCAGAIGHRALNLTNLENGQPLGLTGFGGSAHLVLQEVRYRFPDSKIHVFARDATSREFALQLGAEWAGDTRDRAPSPLRAIIDTTPAWTPVVEALANLAPGGRLVINAIRKEDQDHSALLSLRYGEHLWMEREIKTVANITAADIRDYLPLAARISVRPEITEYPLASANEALCDLKFSGVRGAKVLRIAVG